MEDLVRENGDIEGALYCLCYRSTLLQARIIIRCHGYRPVGIPLVADVNPDDEFYRHLLEEGWVVSATSYRREGYILRDAVQDVHNLRNAIVRDVLEKNGCSSPPQVILYGESMGGPIMTLAVEERPDLYSGVLALGAAMWIRKDPPDNPIAFNFQPKKPILFLSNNTEIGPPRQYIDSCKEMARESPDIFIPVLWYLNRGGHIVLNNCENKRAWDALLLWCKGHAPEDGDATIETQNSTQIENTDVVCNFTKLNTFFP